MKDPLKVLYKGGEAEICEKRSRFIATTHPVRTEDEAAAFIEEIRKKYYDARHNCYAFVIGEEGLTARMSDDGEPSQTAGLPILNVLRNRDITDAAIVVTRYFGGTLLGTGGLFRAYTKAAELGLDNSVTVEKRQAERWKIRMDYADLGKIRNYADREGLFVLGAEYSEMAVMDLLIPLSKRDEAAKAISEKTGARVIITPVESLPFALLDDELILFDQEALALQKD